MEAKLVPAGRVRTEADRDRRPEPRGHARRRLRTLARLPFATARCGPLLHGVSAVFSMGGYAAGPPVMAALLRRMPVVVMEPNAVPGSPTASSAGFVTAR